MTSTSTTPKTKMDRIDQRLAEARRLARLDARQELLFRRLSILRGRLAADAGLPAFRILTNDQLLSLCESPPSDEAALGGRGGLSRLQMLAFGAEVLAVARAALQDAGNSAGEAAASS